MKRSNVGASDLITAVSKFVESRKREDGNEELRMRTRLFSKVAITSTLKLVEGSDLNFVTPVEVREHWINLSKVLTSSHLKSGCDLSLLIYQVGEIVASFDAKDAACSQHLLEVTDAASLLIEMELNA